MFRIYQKWKIYEKVTVHLIERWRWTPTDIYTAKYLFSCKFHINLENINDWILFHIEWINIFIIFCTLTFNYIVFAQQYVNCTIGKVNALL